MSLFVGNISKNVRKSDLQDEFERFGKCEVNFKGSFAFVEFDNERDAEDAVDDLQGKDMGGLKINIEWSKKSGRFSAKDSKRPNKPERRSRDDLKCYNCGKSGHFARDCKNRRKSRSRSRDGGRRNDRDRRRRNSGSRSNSRGRNRGRDNRGGRRRSRSDSRNKRRHDSSSVEKGRNGTNGNRKRSVSGGRSPSSPRRGTSNDRNHENDEK